ncbi:MAG: hypothetical protein JSU06_00465 [Actinobacteria bacterium]|nr:hypothetical protein [Actinomycetota bacterium]
MSDVAAGDLNTDCALSVLRHEAVRPRVEEAMASRRRDGSLEPSVLAGDLRPLIEEALDGTTEEDWQVAALCLIEDDEAGDLAGGARPAPGGFERRRAA